MTREQCENGATQSSESFQGFQEQSILGSGAFADFEGRSASSPIVALTLRAVLRPIQCPFGTFPGVFSFPVKGKELRSLAGRTQRRLWREFPAVLQASHPGQL